ncbi:putative gibberellin 20 oxidase [Annulohypoxylon maeteangense]|uniref:putative gibberellin 20 oxidase n=1 Tax=Annulohypoxylon maeteangense TaxID=1927788 RepID=UPI0020075058|nr:putative gibberellin 20 oxidase [Annulohypoxylon maeteangense]KAI0886613.1 putative gibberellin 20 oxidase [Annulohypoxylon maeteangense]
MAVDQGPPAAPVTIPVIDISGYIAGDSTRTAQIAEELSAACRAPGFFQIVGHDVSSELRTRLFEKTAQFYRLPSAKKSALGQGFSANGARGYEALGAEIMEGDFKDQKEGFMMGPELPPGRFLQGPNLWPEEVDCPEFRSTMEEYFAAARGLSVKLFRLLALSLHLEEHYFDDFVNSRDSISMYRIHKYPRTDAEMAKKSRGTGAHTDFGAMTLLLQDNIGGLEVFHRPTDTWNAVPYVQDAYVVNIGDMMEQWTNGRYMSTVHRVISPISDRDRYSVVFFNEGLLDQVIECIPTCIEPGETPLHPPVTVEAHLRRRYGDSYGVSKDKGTN